MNIPRALLMTALVGSTSVVLFAPTTAVALPSAERKARAACVAEARQLGAEIRPGACNSPRSRIRFLAAAREACAKSMMVASGTLKCVRAPVDDK
jgi:hypothetical protein